jgi:hypothetical protein
LLAVAVLVAALAIPAFAAGEATVGQFIQEMARAKNLNATDARIALDSLAAVGIRLPENLKLSKRLTEADVVQIARAAGLPVNTSDPEAAFDRDQVDSFFSVFAVDLGANPPPNDGIIKPYGDIKTDPFTKGKGKKTGFLKKGRTPTEPE